MKKLLLGAMIFAVMTVFFLNNTFYIIENNFQDRFIQDRRSVDPRLKIVAIDDRSLSEIGKWPWPREILAHTAERLIQGGAKAVFVDVLYTEADQDPAQDEAWQNVLSANKHIYLPAYFQLQTVQNSSKALAYTSENRPVYDIRSSQMGHINVLEDRDRVVRKAHLGITGQDGQIVPLIDVHLANELLPDDRRILWNDRNKWMLGSREIPVSDRSEIYFSYASAPQDKQIETVSVSRLLDGSVPYTHYANSVVLIGPYSVGLQDQYATPMSKTLRMYGIEIHANLVQSFLDGSLYNRSSTTAGVMLLLVLSLGSLLLMTRLRAKWATAVFAAVFVLYTTAVYVCYVAFHLLLPYFYPVLALTTAFVSNAIWKSIEERRERHRVVGIFGRYVSKSVVQEILSSGQELKLGGVRRDVTLMFVDIRGFTPMSEKMEPEDVIELLNEYLELGTKSVFAYEGTLDKFIGDGIMSLFGAPIPQEDHALRAVRAALLMKKGADELARRLEEKYGRSVHFGIGVNSGPAVVGNIGSHDRLDYTAIGDTVNLAARLESNAKPSQILISENTYERIRDHFDVIANAPIKVKGKEMPVANYEVIGEKTTKEEMNNERIFTESG